jgi:OmpA-OmpF porin, OOP family
MLLFSAGYAPPAAKEQIILLPNAAGRAGSLIVTTPHSRTILDRPYRAVDVRENGLLGSKTWREAQVKQEFKASLAAQPPPPASYIVYFLLDRDELTPESKTELARIEAELAKRPAPEIQITGYTDRLGSESYNDFLSLKRAEAIYRALVGAGIAGEIEVAGRGERDPLIPTADGAAEPRNRRVEISVR